MTILSNLPPVRGRYRENVSLADATWFRVGGAAQVVFRPEDTQDLADFLRAISRDSVQSARADSQNDSHPVGGHSRSTGSIPVTVLGAASNVVVRDGGIEGVVVKLGRGFSGLSIASASKCSERGSPEPQAQDALDCHGADAPRKSVIIEAGAANLDVNVAQFALQHSLTGLEFLSGIPGAIGGAIRMNAGAYGSEIKDVLQSAEMVLPSGEIKILSNAELGFAYRHCSAPEGAIFTRCWLRAQRGDAAHIAARMQEIKDSREESQPVRARTGGSTFRNPAGAKAWELIDAAGLRGTIEGGAMVSEKHCNFLINTGSATAADLERLVNRIIRQVRDHSGIELEPEIKFIGQAQSKQDSGILNLE